MGQFVRRLVWTTHRGIRSRGRPAARLTAEGEATPWLPDVSNSRSSATGCRPSCPTSTRTRRANGSSRSTRSCAPEGRARARYLMLRLLERAREQQVGVPGLRSTDYINTIPPEREPWFPGDEHVERRIRAYIRWNAAVMVSRANRPGLGVGGHIATYASRGLAVRGRLQPLLPRQGPRRVRRPGLLPGPRRAGHLRPRLPRGPADRGPARRVPAGALAPGRRAVVLPAPAADAGLLGVPDRLDGPRPAQRDLPGPVQPLPAGPRASTTPRGRTCGRSSATARWTSPSRSARSALAAREELDNLTFVINCNLQRLDGPVRGNGKIIQELEAYFRGAGWNVIKVIWGRDWDPLLAQDTDGVLVNKMNTTPDGQFQTYTRRVRRVHPRALLRRRPAAAQDGRAPVRRRAAQAVPRRPRLPQGVRGVQGGARAHRPADGDPRADHQGLDARQGLRGRATPRTR